MRHPSGPVPRSFAEVIDTCPTPACPVALLMRRLNIFRKQRVLRMCLDGDPVVWLVAIVRRGRLRLVINRLTTVHTDRVLSLISFVALHSQSFPRRSPSRIAHAHLTKKAGPSTRLPCLIERYRHALQLCWQASILLPRSDSIYPDTSFYQSSGISREICLQQKSAAPMEETAP